MDENVIKSDEKMMQSLAQRIRIIRDDLLRSTDFVFLPDMTFSTEQINEVIAYRDALRKIPNQDGFPKNVSFPPKPNAIK